MNNPYFNGENYVAQDGSEFPDYDGAYWHNEYLIGYQQSVSVNQVLEQSTAPAANEAGGWQWLTPVLGGIVNTAGQIAATKINTAVGLANIEAQGRLTLAQQEQTLRLANASNKVEAAPQTNNWVLPVGLAVLFGLLALR